jgi:hypothetical protein
MATIKIGRKEYEIKEGDYIATHHGIFSFYAGDSRILKTTKSIEHDNLCLAKATFKNTYQPLIYSFLVRYKKLINLNCKVYIFTAQTIALLDKPNKNALRGIKN